MRKRSNMRFANGVISAFIVCFFAVHGLLGSFSPITAYTSPIRWIVWIGIGIVALHVVVSIVTSREQLTDSEFPPSARKKRHLALKWITGSLLAAAVVAHVMGMRTMGSLEPVVLATITVVLAAVLAVHVWVGAKSLLTDLGLSKTLMTPLRVVMCVLAITFAVMAVTHL